MVFLQDRAAADQPRPGIVGRRARRDSARAPSEHASRYSARVRDGAAYASAMARRTLPHLAHWGAFRITVDDDEIVGVEGHPDDPAPSPLLENFVGGIRHPARVTRPAIRRGWFERGPGPDERRGSDAFVEVEWDEALDAVARELQRVRTHHGNEAIFGGSYGWASAGRFHHAQSQLHRFLNTAGGYTFSVNSYSLGASEVILPHVVGGADEVLRRATTWKSILEHSELVVAFGGMNVKNAWVSPGGVTRHTLAPSLAAAARRGLAFELFSPLRSDLVPDIGAAWHPIVPGTDTAVMLALAHVLVREGLYDAAFCERYCVGTERLIAYVLGEADGHAKTPEWAETVSGIPADVLRDLARRMAARRTLVTVSWALQRTRHGEQPVWMGIALAALLGQIGLPGGGFGHGYGSMADVGAPRVPYPLPVLPQGRNPVTTFIPVAQITALLENPGGTLEYDGRRLPLPDIRLVYWAGGNPFHHHQDLNRLRRAIARPDTVVVHDPFWTAAARHADIVLPATTSLERDDVGGGRNDGYVIAMPRALTPYGEARDDYEIFAALAKRLGTWDDFTEGRSAREWVEHIYERFRTRVAERDLAVPAFDEFWRAGEAHLPVSGDDHALFDRFRADPDARRLATPSGRIELYSETIAGYGYDDCPGHPVWLEPDEWLGGARAAEFPLHLIANQPAPRLHGQLDAGAYSRASKVGGREPIRMHPDDARTRGITDGDVVRVFNDRGACLAGAVLTTDVRPRVVNLSTGAWFDPVDPEVVGSPCAHGNPNVLTADRGTSRLAQGSTGQHVLVQVERYDGEPPPVRAHRPPELVARPGGPPPSRSGV
jgi:biotin/methionine sulfoxide reductase